MKNNQPFSTRSRGGRRPGAGRKRGSRNKLTRELKDMILTALSDAGGEAYLLAQAEKNPGAFLTLVGKVLPMTLKTEGQAGVVALFAGVPDHIALAEAERMVQAATNGAGKSALTHER